jgi:predicted amidohydrolase
LPFPETAILAETPMNQEAVAVADLDWESLLAARESDDVRNWHDRHRGDYRLITD